MGCNKLVWLGLMDINISQKLGRNVKVDILNVQIQNINRLNVDIGDKEDE